MSAYALLSTMRTKCLPSQTAVISFERKMGVWITVCLSRIILTALIWKILSENYPSTLRDETAKTITLWQATRVLRVLT